MTRARPPARRPVAVLLSRFPLITETFILREVIEMERQGQPVRLVPLLHEAAAVVHREALPWMGRVLRSPLASPAVLAANLRALRCRPAAWLRLAAGLVRGSAASPGLLLRTLALFPKSVWIAERLEAEGVGHVHAHFATHPATTACVVSALTGIPWSVTVHAHDIFVDRTMLRQKLASASFVRAISRFNRETLARSVPDLATEVRVVHVGIDPAVYRRLPPPPAPAAPAAGGAPAKVLCVAALKPYKGLPVLLDACARLRQRGVALRCEIAGEGPLRPELERRIAAAGLAGTVELLGALPQHEVARRLGEAAVVVLPSIVAPDGQMEGIPVALMEAMAAGRPVVASALSGIPELVEDGASGLLVDPGDAAGIAAAVERLLADPALARRMGERGRETVERGFRLDRTVADLLALIDRHAAPADQDVADLLDRAGLAGAAVRRVHRRMDSLVVEALALTPGPSPIRSPGPPGEGSDDAHDRPLHPSREARDVVLKVHRSRPGESRPAPARARWEHETLTCLDRRFAAEPGFGVPRPLGLVEAESAVLMERCPGTPLDELVRRGRAGRGAAWEEHLAALRRAGRWLAIFQRQTGREGDGRPALDALLDRAAADLAACRPWLPGALARDVASRLGKLPGRIGAAGLALVGHHGDLWPGNFYVEDGPEGAGVRVIDLEGFRWGLPAEDAAYFLVHLEPYFAWPGLRGRGERAAAAFLEGWLGGEPLDRSALELCRTAKALQVLARTPGDGWRARRLRRSLAAVLRRAEAAA